MHDGPSPTGLAATGVRAILELALIVCATCVAIVAIGWFVTAWLAVPLFALWLHLVVRTAQAYWRTPLAPDEPIAVLDARNEPELFALFDDVADQMAMPRVTQIDVIDEVNAYVWHPDGKHPRIGIGASLFATLNRTEMVAVLAHELGHAHAGDGLCLEDRCVRALARLSLACGPVHVLAWWVRRRFETARSEQVPRRRRNELRADGWSAFVAGTGAVGASGRALGRAQVVFSTLHAQLENVARTDGNAVDDLFPLMRAAWTAAGDATLDALLRGYGGDEEDPDAVHPSNDARAAHADTSVARIARQAPTVDDPIRNWLARPEETERAWTRTLSERWSERRGLKKIAPHLALLRSYALVAREADDDLAERARNVAITELPLSARLKLVLRGLPSGGRDLADREWLVPLKIGTRTTTTTLQSFRIDAEDAADLITGLLFGGVLRDVLYGKLEHGIPARVWLGSTWYTVSFLAIALADGDAKLWRLVLEETERYERAEKTDPNAKALLPAWRGAQQGRARARRPASASERMRPVEERAATS